MYVGTIIIVYYCKYNGKISLGMKMRVKKGPDRVQGMV
jgi:hypothetical protein